MEARMRLVADGGKVICGGDSIRVEKANSVTVYLTAATDYFGTNPAETASEQMAAVTKRSWTDIRQDHIADYQSFFNRVSIDLGSGDGGWTQSYALTSLAP